MGRRGGRAGLGRGEDPVGRGEHACGVVRARHLREGVPLLRRDRVAGRHLDTRRPARPRRRPERLHDRAGRSRPLRARRPVQRADRRPATSRDRASRRPPRSGVGRHRRRGVRPAAQQPRRARRRIGADDAVLPRRRDGTARRRPRCRRRRAARRLHGARRRLGSRRGNPGHTGARRLPARQLHVRRRRVGTADEGRRLADPGARAWCHRRCLPARSGDRPDAASRR